MTSNSVFLGKGTIPSKDVMSIFCFLLPTSTVLVHAFLSKGVGVVLLRALVFGAAVGLVDFLELFAGVCFTDLETPGVLRLRLGVTSILP